MTNAVDKMNDKKLLKYIIEEIHNRGVIGEEESSLALIAKILLRLCNNAHPTSSNVLVSDQTGAGKDFLTKNVCSILCKKDETYFHRTGLSPKVLNYWQPEIDKKKVSWNGKVLYLEDPEEDLIKSQAFKVMASGGSAITVLKDQKILDKKIDGKPVIIITSMKTQIDVEGQRRWDAVRVDASGDISRKVVDDVFLRATGQKVEVGDATFCSLLQTLREYEVIIPYATTLGQYIKNPDTIDRTQINKLLDYIKASTILHQYQRQKDEEGRLLATPEDYEFARCVFIYLRNKEGNALNRTEERLIDYLRDEAKPKKLTEIITDLECISKTWLFENKEGMIEKGVVSSVTKFDALSNREMEHLEATKSFKLRRKDMPPAKKVFKNTGYLASGDFYREINAERKKEGLKPIFEKVM